MSSIINYLTTIRFGEGAISGLGDDLTELGITQALVIADKGVVEAGLAQRVFDSVPGEKIVGIFDDVPSNPTEDAAEAAAEMYRARGADGLIAIGGGSPIDLAKAVALLASHGGPIEPYAAILGGVSKIGSVAPVIAVPTTAGTGAEVGRAALITLRDGRKLAFIAPTLIPRHAVCDPELTYGMPPWLTAATGLDAISHCVETFLSPRHNPPAEAIALDGLSRAVTNIEAAFSDGSDPEARRAMMMAALMGGLTFQKGLGAIHAISHPLGGLKDPSLHHGTLNAVLLPHVLDFNADAAPDKYRALAEAVGIDDAGHLAEHFDSLNRALGLPTSLSQMGVPRQIIPSIVDGAMADHSCATNPKPLTEDTIEGLIEAAW